MASSQDTERRGPGRPPDVAKREAILAATSELLAEVGYASMTIDAVANRAGCSRMLIYRVWDTKLALAADAVMGTADRLVVPDLGSLDADLRDFVAQNVAHMTVPAYVNGVPGLTVELLNDPEATRTIWRRYVEPSERGFSIILDRARERGEVVDPPSGFVVTRLVSGITTSLAQTSRLGPSDITDLVMSALSGGLLDARS